LRIFWCYTVACTAVAMQQRNKQRCLQPVSRQRISKDVPATKNTHTTVELFLETVLSIRSVHKGVIRKTIWATQSVESQPVKRRLGGWCEMAASLRVS
jgi:hypothetical protein